MARPEERRSGGPRDMSEALAGVGLVARIAVHDRREHAFEGRTRIGRHRVSPSRDGKNAQVGGNHLAAVAFAVLTTAGMAGAAEEKFISWADLGHRHGWTDVTSGGPIVQDAPPDPPCPGTQRGGGSIAFVCATENGGRSWRPIFQAGHGLIYLIDFVRTSRTAGVVSISRSDAFPRSLRTGVFWTRDNGAHWYETTRIGPLVEHRRGRLFWRSHGGPLYEVRPWPPLAAVRCPGFFAWHAFDQRPRKDGNVCVGGRVDAGMRSILASAGG